MSLLITGAEGFLGQHVAERLHASGAQVIASTSPHPPPSAPGP